MQATGLRLLLASATLLAASNAMALSLAPRVDETFERCRARAQGVIEQASCIAAEADRQDARLNRIYQQLLARLNPAQKTALVAAQRTWLQFRQQDATLETSLYEDSQPANLQAADTDMQRLRARADQLQVYLRLLD